MIKGYQRKMIKIQNMDSRIFDEAYFILKCGVEAKINSSEEDMIREAERIVNANLLSEHCLPLIGEKRKKHRISTVKAFAAGVFFCGILSAVIFFIVNHG